MPRLKVLFVVSECVPFAKTGGLADVAGALPIALAERGHDVRVVLPRYRVAMRRLVNDGGSPGKPGSAPIPSVNDGGSPGKPGSAPIPPVNDGGSPPAERLPDPLVVPLGHGEAIAAVWQARLGESSARAYLLEHNAMFDRDGIYGDKNGDFGDNLARYSFLSRGALRLCRAIGFQPDIVHVHDWQASLVPVYMNTLEADAFGRTASVLTIHNLAYQGWFGKGGYAETQLPWEVFNSRGLEAYDKVNLLKGGIYHSTLVTTVSPRYAAEIQTEENGEGLDGALRDRGGDVLGILNGIDDAVWNPEADSYTAAPFSAEDLRGKAICKAALQAEVGLPQLPDVPLLGLVSRFAHQKGIDIVAGALGDLLALGVQVVVLGSGEPWAEQVFSRLSAVSDRFRAYIGMNEALAHKIEAGADIFLMPSRYEPCGLNQLYSQRYGTLPVVRAVGGLDDTVEHEVTGFKFDELSADALAQTVAWAVYLYRNRPEHFREMQRRAMRKPMGWGHASLHYEALYRMATSRRFRR